MATATWLLVTAAGQPPLTALTVAIVVGAGAGHRPRRAALRRTAGRPRRRAAHAHRGARPDLRHAGRRAGTAAPERSGDTLSRLVSDVDDVQDLLLRVLVPGAAAALVAVLSVAGAALLSPAAALGARRRAAGRRRSRCPPLAARLSRRTADRVAPLRGAFAADAVDLTAGAADLAAFGATGDGAAPGRRDGRASWPGWSAGSPPRGWAVDAAGVLVAGATAAAVHGRGAARRHRRRAGRRARGGHARRGRGVPGAGDRRPPVDRDPRRPGTGSPSCCPTSRPAARARAAAWHGCPDGPRRGVPARTASVVRYRDGAAPALDGVDLTSRPAAGSPSSARAAPARAPCSAVLTGAVAPAPARPPSTAPTCPRTTRSAAAAVGGLLAEAHVFHATVRDNLLLGRAGATDDDLARGVPRRRACSTGYASSRPAWTRWSARTAASSPAASGSGSRWPGRCWPARTVLRARRADRGARPGRRRRGARLGARARPATAPWCWSPTGCAGWPASTRSWCWTAAGWCSAATPDAAGRGARLVPRTPARPGGRRARLPRPDLTLGIARHRNQGRSPMRGSGRPWQAGRMPAADLDHSTVTSATLGRSAAAGRAGSRPTCSPRRATASRTPRRRTRTAVSARRTPAAARWPSSANPATWRRPTRRSWPRSPPSGWRCG